MIEHVPNLIEAGVDSFKIEGRMKTALYVAAVTRTYRRAIDDYRKSPELYRQNLDYYREEIAKCTYRQFTTGFYYGKTDENAQIYDANTYIKEYTYIGIVQETDERGFVKIYQRNKFSVGEEIEIMLPDGTNLQRRVLLWRMRTDSRWNPLRIQSRRYGLISANRWQKAGCCGGKSNCRSADCRQKMNRKCGTVSILCGIY